MKANVKVTFDVNDVVVLENENGDTLTLKSEEAYDFFSRYKERKFILLTKEQVENDRSSAYDYLL